MPFISAPTTPSPRSPCQMSNVSGWYAANKRWSITSSSTFDAGAGETRHKQRGFVQRSDCVLQMYFCHATIYDSSTPAPGPWRWRHVRRGVSLYLSRVTTLVLASVRTILCQGCTWSLSWNEHLVSEGQKPGLVFEAAVSYNHDHHQFVRLAGV